MAKMWLPVSVHLRTGLSASQWTTNATSLTKTLNIDQGQQVLGTRDKKLSNNGIKNDLIIIKMRKLC